MIVLLVWGLRMENNSLVDRGPGGDRGVLILAGMFGAGLWVAGRIKGKRSPESQTADA